MDNALSRCSDGLLDTGNPIAQVEIPGSDTIPWTPGTSVGVIVGPTDDPLVSFSYTMSSMPKAGVDATETDDGAVPLINLGVELFTRYDVLFAPRAGQVGIASR